MLADKVTVTITRKDKNEEGDNSNEYNIEFNIEGKKEGSATDEAIVASALLLTVNGLVSKIDGKIVDLTAMGAGSKKSPILEVNKRI